MKTLTQQRDEILEKILFELDKKLYDDLTEYEQGLKDVLNVIFEREDVLDLSEHFFLNFTDYKNAEQQQLNKLTEE